jgi:uncharacterized small protein (DUF1192 family)
MIDMLEHYEPERKIARLEAEIDRLRAQTAELRGAMQAADERLLSSGKRVGFVFGCDTPDAMADEIARLRAENAELRVELHSVLNDWNALVAASGSPTNGGAVGYVKALRVDAERHRALSKVVEAFGGNMADVIASLEEAETLRAENAELRGAMQAADERLLKAGQRVGLIFGCDTPAALADEIARLRAENAKLRADAARLDVDLDAAATTIQEILEAAIDQLRDDAERYRWLVQWMHQHGLLREHFCQPSAFEKVANWWVLKEPAMIKGDSCVGYGDTSEKAINAAMRNHSEPVQIKPPEE